jgi:hypothetical protein
MDAVLLEELLTIRDLIAESQANLNNAKERLVAILPIPEEDGQLKLKETP